MSEKLLNCWEILECGREKNGDKVNELGECIASIDAMGHSCWIAAGTLCGGKVQGTYAQKLGYCTTCDVYKIYNRATGNQGKKIQTEFPEEHMKYCRILLEKSQKKV